MPSDTMPDVPPICNSRLRFRQRSSAISTGNSVCRKYSVMALPTRHTVTTSCSLPEFDLVLAHEPTHVAQVILETMRQTIGWVGDGPGNRRLWAKLSGGHFAKKGVMDRDDANKKPHYRCKERLPPTP